MFFQIELLYFLVMIAVFILLVLLVKMPSGIAMMISAVVGMAMSAIISKTEFSLRELVDGAFGYFDTILIITAAMIFMGGLQASGALEYISALLVKKLYKHPKILLLFFMLIIMFPAMVTGSSLASIISSGALVAPIMIKMGIKKERAGAIIAFGAILGMIAPPINVPVMAICDVVDIPYTGFTLPLLILTIPLAVFVVLFLGRGVKEIDLNEMAQVIDFSILEKKKDNIEDSVNTNEELVPEVEENKKEGNFFKRLIDKYEDIVSDKKPQGKVTYSWVVLLPIIILVLLIVLESVLPKVFGKLGMALIFIIATLPTFFVGRKPNVIKVLNDGVHKSFGAMGLLCGVGMFVQVLTLSGARGWFVANVITLPSAGQYIAMGLSLPIFGGISAFGSASILGGPFVMAFLKYSEIVVASGLSLLAAMGEFLPPTAMSATFAAQTVEEKNYLKLTREAIIPLIVTLVYTIAFIFVIGYFAKKGSWF